MKLEGGMNTVDLKDIWHKYGATIIVGTLLGLATLGEFFFNVREHFKPNWLVKLVTLPGFISYQLLRNILPVHKLPILPETLGFLLYIFVPMAIGASIGILIHWINNNLIPTEK